jgi:hypothetical protein
MRPRVIAAFAIAAIILGGIRLVPAAYARLGSDTVTAGAGGGTAPAPTSSPTPPPRPTLAAAPVNVKVDGFLSWALLDRKNGKISGSNTTATNSTESMIKVWIVSDFLRQQAARGRQPTKERLAQASTAIRDSNDDAASSLYNAAGGKTVIDRLIKICGLTETKAVIPPGKSTVWWSYTRISARDAVRMGQCVKSGKAAGAKWTKWVLSEMAQVRGTTARKDQQLKKGGGRWGIIDGLPPEIRSQGQISIKNGWTLINADGMWHVNCLAVADDWVLAVLMRYPAEHGLDYGATVCENVTTQLVTPVPGAALKIPRPLVQG